MYRIRLGTPGGTPLHHQDGSRTGRKDKDRDGVVSGVFLCSCVVCHVDLQTYELSCLLIFLFGEITTTIWPVCASIRPVPCEGQPHQAASCPYVDYLGPSEVMPATAIGCLYRYSIMAGKFTIHRGYIMLVRLRHNARCQHCWHETI